MLGSLAADQHPQNVALVQPPGELGTACTNREQLPADIRPHIAGGVFDCPKMPSTAGKVFDGPKVPSSDWRPKYSTTELSV